MLLPPAPPSLRDDESAAGQGAQLTRNLGPALALGGERLRVRVALGFFLFAAVPGIAGGIQRMALCAATVFFAVLVHELGHAACGLLWGSRVTIVLHVLGPHTLLEPRLTARRELLAILLGPTASIALGSLLFSLQPHFPAYPWLSTATWINFIWGGVNLLPLLPFDGGRALLNRVRAERRATTLLVSGALALVIALVELVALRSAALFFLFGVAAFASLLRWSHQRRLELEQALELPQRLARAHALLAAGAAEPARQLATRVGVRARCNGTANAAWQLRAWAELELGRCEEALGSLARIRPASDVHPHCLAAVQAARGQTRVAVGLLERARSSRRLSLEALKLLIDLLAQLGSFERACAVAGEELASLTPDDARHVLEAAFARGELACATRLASQLFALTGSPDDAVSHAYGLARLGDRTKAKRIFSQLVSSLSNWQMQHETRLRLRDLAARPESIELLGPELSQLARA